MGDVGSGTLTILIFCMVFAILFPFFGYAFTNMAGATSSEGVGEIELSDLGLPMGYMWTKTAYLEKNNTWYEYSLGTGADEKKYETRWHNGTLEGGSYNNTFTSAHQDWWIFWSNDWDEIDNYENIWLNETDIISNWDNVSKYTRIHWRIDQNKDSSNFDYYMFFFDWNETGVGYPDIERCLLVDNKVKITFAKGVKTLTQAGILEVGGWAISMLIFTDTYGMGAIPILNILLWIITVMGIVSLAIFIKAMVSEWL